MVSKCYAIIKAHNLVIQMDWLIVVEDELWFVKFLSLLIEQKQIFHFSFLAFQQCQNNWDQIIYDRFKLQQQHHFFKMLQIYYCYEQTFQIEQINNCVSNVKAFMHLNTHFIEFEFLNHNSVKPLENTLSTLLGIGFYIVFLICI